MALPEQLRSQIETLLDSSERSRLARAAEQITADYKQGRFTGSLRRPESRLAYLLTRMPATYAANAYVFQQVRRAMPEFGPEDMLDLGCGPGTAMWAAREVWPDIGSVTLLDSNRELLELGRSLSGGVPNLQWDAADISSMERFPAADLVVLSYALGELESPAKVVARAWQAARKAVVIIEPGTPRNFAVVAKIRAQLIEAGGHPMAPCPHVNACPMAEAGDWCHFAVRLERTAEHRRLKSAALGYEDEKLSYLAFAKQPSSTPISRILRHPEIHGGHIRLTLCAADGLKSSTVTKSDKPMFRAARKAEWGDAWPPELGGED